MQAALRLIGSNLRGFSQSRTIGLTPMHRRRLNISAILCFIVPQSDFLPGLEVADISACIPRTMAGLEGPGGGCPCTPNRKGCTLCAAGRRESGGAVPLSCWTCPAFPVQTQKRRGRVAPPRVAVCVQFAGVKPIARAFFCTCSTVFATARCVTPK